jgi:competence protein ComEA
VVRAVFILALAVGLAGPACKSESRPAPPAGQATIVVDLNSATAAELEALPEIGKVHADKIIRGRPYDNKRQLVSRGIISETIYDRIAPMIVARQR